MQALLEIGEALRQAAYSIFASLGATKDIVSKYIGLQPLTPGGNDYEGLMGIKVPIIGGDLNESIVSLIVLILIFWILLKLTLLLVERMFWLFILAIIAPIVFALSLLPTTQKFASQWWENVIKWILVFPLTIALISLSVTILRAMPSTDTPQKLTAALSGFDSLETLVVNPDILLLIAGLVVLYLAGTVNKMLKIGGSLSGLVATPGVMIATGKKAWAGAYKPVADTATGKTWVGKQMGKAGRRGYDVALGTKPGQKFEGWRQAQKGWVGRVVNPRGEKARLEAGRGIAVRQEQTNILLQRSKRSKEQLDRKAGEHYGINWDALSSDEKSNLERNRNIKLLSQSRNEDRDAAGFFIGKAANEIPIDQVDPITSLEKKATEGNNYGKRAEAVHNIRRISRSRHRPPEERERAEEWLRNSREEIEEVGLDYKKYEPMAKKLPEEEKVGAEGAGEYDEKLIKAQDDLDKAETERKQISTNNNLDDVEIDTIIDEEAISKSPDVASLKSIKTDTLNILESSGVNPDNAGRMGTILADHNVNEPEIQRTVELIINTGMSPKALKIHKKLQEADKSPEDISVLINKIKATANLEKSAQSKIDRATEKLYIDTEEAKETRTRTINAYITSRSVESGETQVRIQQELTKEFEKSYEIVSDKLRIKENTAGTKANVLGSDELEKITQLADKTRLIMGRHATVEDMEEKATLGELAAMLRRGGAATKDIKFEI